MDKKLVLFDVDHTLMIAGKSHKEAFVMAIKEVAGLDLKFPVGMSGMTDLQIIHNLLTDNNIETEENTDKKIINVMIDYFQQADLSDAILLPGVPALLKRMQEHEDIVVGLVTGNIEEIAYTKLKHFGIKEFFLVGGFGHTSVIRSELIYDAIAHAERKIGTIKKNNVFIIGDTPHDIKAAKETGVKVIAVATGSHDVAALKKDSPNYVFNNLQDTDKIIDVILNG